MIFFWPPIILALRHDFEALVPAFSGCSVSEKPSKRATERQLQLGISVETGLTTTRSFAPFYGPGARFLQRILEFYFVRSRHPQHQLVDLECPLGALCRGLLLWPTGINNNWPQLLPRVLPPTCQAKLQSCIIDASSPLFRRKCPKIEQERPLRSSAANVASILPNKTRRHGWYIRECVPH